MRAFVETENMHFWVRTPTIGTPITVATDNCARVKMECYSRPLR